MTKNPYNQFPHIVTDEITLRKIVFVKGMFGKGKELLIWFYFLY